MKYPPNTKLIIPVALAMGLTSVLFSWQDVPEGRQFTIHSAARGGITFDPKGENLNRILARVESEVNAETPLPPDEDEETEEEELPVAEPTPSLQPALA